MPSLKRLLEQTLTCPMGSSVCPGKVDKEDGREKLVVGPTNRAGCGADSKPGHSAALQESEGRRWRRPRHAPPTDLVRACWRVAGPSAARLPWRLAPPAGWA